MRGSRFFFAVLGFVACLGSLCAETDQEVAAREKALELAGAFGNDGFKLRDGHWAGTISPNESRLIAVNLYAGNQYWFSAATPDGAKKVLIDLFDETGAPVKTEKYDAGTKAASGLTVENSGQYFVRLRAEETAPSAIALVYSYK